MRELVEKSGGTWRSHDAWGRRRLAYEIDKKPEGVYHLVVFEASAETLDEITRVLKIDDAVMRHLATKHIEGSRRARRATRHPLPAPRRCRRRRSPAAARAEPAEREAVDTVGTRRSRAMAANINRVVLVGNLTRDPELRHTPRRHAGLQPAHRREQPAQDESGQWVDKPNYFTISVFGNQAESCAQYLSKGRPVAIDGRLDWREWQAQDGAQARGRRDRGRERPVPRQPR